MKLIKIGDRVVLKNQISKREAVVEFITNDGDVFLLKLDSGVTLTKRRSSLALA